jgi:hypothetical protein
VTPVEIYAVALVHLTLLPANAFPLVYSRSPWRSTDVGKALMLKGVAIAAMFDLAVIGFWWPFPGYEYLYAAILTLVTTGISYQFLVMWSLQRRGRYHHSPDGDF